MGEVTMNQKTMYEEIEGIKDLNKVEGFDPRRYMRIIQGEGEAARCYLDVAFRKLWFRLKYSEGKIAKRILKLTERMAVVEARVYLSKDDAEENFVSNALAQKYFSTGDQFGAKYVELAETAAVGRALSDAGFGLQFADREGEADPQVTDAPFDPEILYGQKSLPGDTYMEECGEIIGYPDDGMGTVPMGADVMGGMEAAPMEGENQTEDDNLPGQYNIGDYIQAPGSGNNPSGQLAGPAMRQQPGIPSGQQAGTSPGKLAGNQPGQSTGVQSGQPAGNQPRQSVGNQSGQPAGNHPRQSTGNQPKQPASIQQGQPAGMPSGGQQNGSRAVQNQANRQSPAEIRKDMPAEQIYPLLNRDSAAAIVISAGFHKGKTLGQLAVEKPKSLEWYVTSYAGPDNLLRAAAKLLLDIALGQAG